MDKMTWRKSSYTQGQGNCVEAALLPNVVAVQDSKNPGPMLTVSSDDWAALVATVKNGRLSVR